MANSGERETGGKPSHDARVRLDELRISETQSSRWQKLGAMDEDAFEARTATA
jgi:hypothetical protein